MASGEEQTPHEEKRGPLLTASNAELALLLYDRIDTGRERIFFKNQCVMISVALKCFLGDKVNNCNRKAT